MSSATLARLVSRCRGLSGMVAAASDAELLRRFARSRDADAFAELLGRHAELVWGVCRRTLPQHADCEDAFQATFHAFARHARSIDPDRPLAAWLHAVAVRVARRALGRTLRRRTSDLPTSCTDSADVVRDVGARDLFRAVDEEIKRLPATLKAPLILCCLQGQARDEAAEALGCSVAAVKSRLERARQALRHALTRRGIALPAAFLVVGLGSSSVSSEAKARAVEVALGLASPAVVRLAAAAVPSSAGLVLVALAFVAAVAVSLGVWGVYQAPPKDSPPAAKENPASLSKTNVPKPRVDRFGDPLPDGAVRRFGTLRFRQESVAALAFTPDGKRLIAGMGRNPLAVFDPADGRKLREVGEVSANNNYGFALSPDGKHVFTTGYHLAMYDVETGAKARTFESAVRCNSVAVSPDGKKVTAACEHRAGLAMVFAIETGKKLADLNLKDVKAGSAGLEIHGLAFSPDSRVVAGIVTEYKELKPNVLTATPVGLRMWDAESGNVIGTAGPADDVPVAFAFVPDTKLIACLGSGKRIHLWDTEAGKVARSITLPKEDEPFGAALQVSADGKRAAWYLHGGKVVVFDLKTGKELRRLAVGEALMGPAALALSSDGALLGVGKLYGDSSVRVWEVGTGKERLADAGHRGPATLTLAPDGKTLVSRGVGQVFRWNLATGDGKSATDDVNDPNGYVADSSWLRMTYRTPRYRFIMEHASGELAVQSGDGSKPIAKAQCPKDYWRGAAHSADGRSFALSFQDRGYTVLLWTPETHNEPFRLAGHPDACQQMIFTHDGKYLIAGAGTHNMYKTETIFVYDTATGKLVRKLATNSAPGKMLLTADDRTLITGGTWNDGSVRAWDLASGKELAVMVDPSLKSPSVPEPRGGATPFIGGLALSAGERLLAVMTGNGQTSSVSVWDTGTWRLVKAFKPAVARGDVASLAITRDGRSVFAAYTDSTILEWDASGRFGRAVVPAPTRERLDQLWRELAEPADLAYAAAWELLDHPAEAIELIRSKVSPALPLDGLAVKALVRKLGSDSFREREDAAKKLIALGDAAIPIVRDAAAASDLSAEGKERAEKVIAALTAAVTPDQLRLRHAVAVLEWSARADGDEHLRKLASGDPGTRLTADAKAAIKRREVK